MTPAGQIWKGLSDANERLRDASPYFSASVDRDGTFRIDDVPPGNYVLNIHFDRQNAAGNLQNYKFTVPSGSDERPEQPIELGVVKLER